MSAWFSRASMPFWSGIVMSCQELGLDLVVDEVRGLGEQPTGDQHDGGEAETDPRDQLVECAGMGFSSLIPSPLFWGSVSNSPTA